MQWWSAMYNPDPKKMLKPKIRPTNYQIFATLHRVKAIKAGLPDLYAYGDAIWVTELYYRGDIMGMAITSETRLRLIRGDLYPRIYKAQKQGEIWLRRIGGVLCGPDLFWERVIIPIGPDFYFGTMIGEMQMLVDAGAVFNKIMNYDFEECRRMKQIRKKEKEHAKRLIGREGRIENRIDSRRINRRRIRFVR